MRILLATPTFGVHGGIEVFVTTLAAWLVDNTRHEVKVCFKRVKRCAISPLLEQRCRTLGLDYEFVEPGSAALRRSIRWADIVHGNNCSPDVTLLAKLAGKPLVLTIHNWFRGKTGLRNRLWFYCSRLADWRTYNSRFVLDTWEPAGTHRLSELMPTVSVLPAVEAPYALRKGFFFIARLIENKGLDILVKAYAAARIDRGSWPLHIAGTGPLSRWVSEYVAQQSITGIEILGFLPETEKAHRIAHARWLVAPANTREDMGLTPIEARNVAVPAIVTRDGGLPEAAGPAALLCEPGDVASLTAALEQAVAMSATEYQARARLAKESLAGYLRPLSDYMAIYTRLLGKERP